MTTPVGGGISPRELDLRLARRALRKKLVDSKVLSELLLEQAARPATSLADLLQKRGVTAAQVEALRSELDPAMADDEVVEEQLTKDDPLVGKIILTLRCDARIEQTRFMTSYVGRLPRDPEPASLLLISTDAIRSGLWVDFLETVRAAKNVKSAGLVQVLDCGRADGAFAIVSRYKAGSLNLRTLLDRVRRLKLSESLRIARELAQAVADLHAAKLVHRDIKAQNVVLTREGQVQLRRAGIVFEPEGAQAFAPRGTVFGSPHTIAPEALRGEQPDPMNDIYALGVVLYEMVAGTRPFEGEGIEDLRPQHLEQPPIRPDKVLKDVPDSVSELLVWLLSKKPKDRPNALKLVNIIQNVERNIHRSGTTERFQAFGG